MTNISLEEVDSPLKKVLDSLDSHWVRTSFILSKLDFSTLNLTERRKSKFPRESFIKLYLYKRIKGLPTYYNLKNSMDDTDLKNLGLTEGIPKKRTFNEFFQKNLSKDQIMSLNDISERILSAATRKGIILDIEIVKEAIKKKKPHESKAFKEAVKLVKKLVYPQIELQIRHNAKFTIKDLLDILIHLAQTHDFANNGVKTFSELNPNMEIPSRETVLYHFRKMDKREEIEEMFRRIFDVILEFGKKNYSLIRKRKLDVAIDVHEVPYYGNKSDHFVIGGRQDRGTNHFFKFITCSIVLAGRRFVLDALMIHPLDNLDGLVDKLIKRAKQKIRIDKVYLDRGFDRPSIIRVLKKNHIRYLMPKVRSSTVKQWFDKAEDCKSKVIKDFKIGDETTTLVLVNDEEGVKRAFSTNLDIPEQLTQYLFRFYSRRWGIETSYRQLEHDFKPRTTSKNFHIRLFYFLFSTCLYNMWILINVCVSINLYNRIVEKPLITSKLFAVVLYKVQIDPAG